MKNPVNLFQTLFIFYKSNVVVQRVLKRMIKIENNELVSIASDEELIDFTYYIILEVCTFMEEYEKYSNKVEEEYLQRMIEIRKIIKPIYDKLNNWTDLRKFRGSIIAHNWRDKKHKFVIPNPTIYNIPKTVFDFHLLGDYMRYIYEVINMEFSQEIKIAMVYMFIKIPKDEKQNDYSNINQEITKLQNQVNILCSTYKKNYSLYFTKYTPPSQ